MESRYMCFEKGLEIGGSGHIMCRGPEINTHRDSEFIIESS